MPAMLVNSAALRYSRLPLEAYAIFPGCAFASAMRSVDIHFPTQQSSVTMIKSGNDSSKRMAFCLMSMMVMSSCNTHWWISRQSLRCQRASSFVL